MAANYNNSAWFYDRLSHLVYGRALINAQAYPLQYIQPNSTVLIVGGGTGWTLAELAKIYPNGLQITYVEVSSKMMSRAIKRDAGKNKITFINEAIEHVKLPADFDVVITPFLFDNFKEETLQTVFTSINGLLKTGGLWLNTDFQLTGKWWQKLLLNTMILFFRALCHIEASKLPAIAEIFANNSYIIHDQKTFFGEFIISTVYKKN